MRGWTGQLWPLVLILVFYVVPIQFLTNPHPVYVQDETTRIVIGVVLAISALSAVAALVFVGLALATSLLRMGRPATLDRLHRTATYAAWAGGLALPPVIVLLALSNRLYAVVYAVLVGFYLLYAVPASRRRIGYRSNITVRCTPEAVFAFLTDPHNWPRYLPEVQVIEPVETPLRVGSIVNERITLGRRVVEGQDEVTIIDPNRKLGMQVPGGRAADLYQLKSVDAGTEISYSADHVLGIPEAVIGGVFSRGPNTKFLLARREKIMQRIKEILEAPPAATV